MKFSIVLSTHTACFEAVAFKGDFEANVARIAALGYDGVELAIRDPRLVDVAALDEVLGRYCLAVPAIGTGQAWGEEGLSFTDPDPAVRWAAVERVQMHMPLAAHWGAIVIIGLLRGTVRPGVEREQAMAWLVQALQECSATAAARGVRLALEPINRYETNLINTAAQGLTLIEQVGAMNLGLLLDAFHMNIEEPDIEASMRTVGSRLFHFHVADSNRWHPGAGHLDFRSILSTLSEIGYSGFVSGEFLPKPDAETGAREAIRHLQQALSSVYPNWRRY
ncbi:MAG: 5-keto-L-gluconate epimerase [Anaerolineae bacterium]